jgi:hypothetical protein
MINDLSRLKSQLAISGLQSKDLPLFQIINQLIGLVEKFLNIPPNSILGGGGSGLTTIINPTQIIMMDGIPGEDGNDGIGTPGINGIGTPGSPGQSGVGVYYGIPFFYGEDGEDGVGIPGPVGQNGSPGTAGINTLKVTTPQTINGGAATFVDITELTFPVINGNNYAFKFYIVFRAANVNTGWKASVNHPGGTVDHFSTTQTVANAAAGVQTWLQKHNTVVDDMTLLTSSATANVDLICIIEGRYLCTSNGTFAARFANELAANTDIVIQIGSWGFYF